jgi:hypothetical protein
MASRRVFGTMVILAACLGAGAAAPAPNAGATSPGEREADKAGKMGGAVSPAAAAFERFKALAGTWIGRSTKGWEDEVAIDVIAGGSVVRNTSFNAHPGETMLTLFHMDGDRLMLTHYCVARNQPRMVATRFEEEGRKVAFDFLDATNLPSPGVGHMHSSVFEFRDADHFTSRWTWFQDGSERWMEEIVYERKR